jgi:hypothetical protein
MMTRPQLGQCRPHVNGAGQGSSQQQPGIGFVAGTSIRVQTARCPGLRRMLQPSRTLSQRSRLPTQVPLPRTQEDPNTSDDENVIPDDDDVVNLYDNDIVNLANAGEWYADAPATRSTQSRGTTAKPKKNGYYSDVALQGAIAVVECGELFAAASRYFGVPVTTMRNHIYGINKSRKRGRQGTIKQEEEAELVTYILDMQSCGHPITLTQLRYKVAVITQDWLTPFSNGIPG